MRAGSKHGKRQPVMGFLPVPGSVNVMVCPPGTPVALATTTLSRTRYTTVVDGSFALSVTWKLRFVVRFVTSSSFKMPVSLIAAKMGAEPLGFPGAIGGVVSRMKLSCAKLPFVPDWSVACTRNVLVPSVLPSFRK